MSTAAAPVDAHHTEPVDLTKFGMITFLASEAMLFGGLLTAYLIAWVSKGSGYQAAHLKAEGFSWPLLMTGINTVFLLSSSGTLYWAEKAVVKGKNGALTLGLALTTVLGAIFVSIQFVEWTRLFHEHIWFNSAGFDKEAGHAAASTTYNSYFFLTTGFHGLHVSIGVLFLAITTLMAMFGRFTPHRHGFLTCVSLYWHFVDVVWIGLFTIMYVLPHFFH